MANPQKENGHVDIANEIVEALSRTYLSPTESRVLWAVIRKTYGWHKKMDRISYSQLEELTKLDRWHIAPALKRLVSRNIITQTGNAHTLSYGLQKNFDAWTLPKQVTQTQTLPVWEKTLPKQVMKTLPKQVTTKEKKETIQKKRDLPSFIDKEIWGSFLEVRRKMKVPMTDRAFDLLVKNLVKFRDEGQDPNLVLEQSIVNGWRGVFPLKENAKKPQKGSSWD